jgi:hypothetical protein
MAMEETQISVTNWTPIMWHEVSQFADWNKWLMLSERNLAPYGKITTLRIAKLNIKKFYIPSTQSISMRFRRSKKNQQLFPYTELTDWFP